MKITWLNDELTYAAVIRGRWWWKRQALVKWCNEGGYGRWIFEASETDLDSWDSMHLNELQMKERKRRQVEMDWQPMVPRRYRTSKPNLRLLPPARVSRIGGSDV